jgi:hypothetical protein
MKPDAFRALRPIVLLRKYHFVHCTKKRAHYLKKQNIQKGSITNGAFHHSFVLIAYDSWLPVLKAIVQIAVCYTQKPSEPLLAALPA